MNDLLSQSKQLLGQPLKEARRKLIIILNLLYMILMIVFVTSEKISTGNFLPSSILYYIYVPAFFLNLTSAIYNIQIFRFCRNGEDLSLCKNCFEIYICCNYKKLDLIIGWISIVPIMIMSCANMMGLGNPSNDAIFTDYGLAQSLIIGAVIVIGRKGATVWFLIVLSILMLDVSRLGWNYEYNYLTPTESVNYVKGLENKESWAINRKKELEINGLNPPKASRYFNTWFIFIVVAFMAAYYFSGITIDIFKIIPTVITNIENAIDDRKKVTLELENRQNEITKSAMRIVRYNEILEELNAEIDKLDYSDKKKLLKVVNIMKKALNKETDWERFQTSFDSIHSDFFKILQEKYSHLSRSDMKHLALIKLNLSSSEISRLMDVKIESLRSLRYRLKKKLNLNEDIDLRDFVDGIELID